MSRQRGESHALMATNQKSVLMANILVIIKNLVFNTVRGTKNLANTENPDGLGSGFQWPDNLKPLLFREWPEFLPGSMKIVD